MIHAFGDFILDSDLYQVRRAGREIRIRRQTFEVLAYLLSHRDQIVSKRELFETVWNQKIVSESSLANCISELRAALEDDSGSPQIIQTVYGRGYRFVASVESSTNDVDLADIDEPEVTESLNSYEPAHPQMAAERVRDIFVGRGHELQHLGLALDDAQRGRGRFVLLVGEPGIGKTQTAERFAECARQQGARVAIGRCDEGEGIPPYWPWVQILRACAAERELDGSLGSGAAELAQLLGAPQDISRETLAEPVVDPGTARFRLFEGVTRLLVDLSKQAPVLLVVDDLHNADESSLRMLGFLTRQLTHSRLCIVGTYRTGAVGREPNDPLARFLGDLTHEGLADTLSMSPLEEADVRHLVEQVSPDFLNAGLPTRIYERTEGNPLFVAELVRLLLSKPGDPASRAMLEDVGPIAISAGLRSTIGLRLDQLGGECRRILEVASAIGREFRPMLLQRVAEKKSRKCLDCLQEAIDAGVLSEIPDDEGVHAAGLFRFDHALIRDVIYQGLSLGNRVEIHRRIGAALEDLLPEGRDERAAEIGHHYAQSSDPEDLQKAVTYCRRAGFEAARRFAHDRAVGHFETALAALAKLGTAGETKTCDLLLAQAGALRWTHQYTRLKKTLLEVVDCARRNQDVAHLAGAALLWGGVDTLGTLDETWIGLLEEALRGIGEEDGHLRAALLAILVVARFPIDPPETSLALNQQAMEMSGRIGDRRGQSLGLCLRRSFLLGPDRFDECSSLGDDAVELAITSRDPAVELIARASRLRENLEGANASDLDAEIGAIERLAGQPDNSVSLSVRETVALLQGRFDEAEGILARNYGDRLSTIGDTVFPPKFACPMFVLLRDRGRLAEMEPALRSAALRSPDFPLWTILLAMLLSETERRVEARRAFDEIAGRGFDALPRNGLWLGSVIHLSDVCVELGASEHAAALHAMLEPFAGRVATVAGLVCVGPACLALGRLETLLDSWADADRNLHQALELATRLQAQPFEARALTSLAAMLLRRRGAGDLAHASSLLKQARITVDRIGLRGALERSLRALEASVHSPEA